MTIAIIFLCYLSKAFHIAVIQCTYNTVKVVCRASRSIIGTSLSCARGGCGSRDKFINRNKHFRARGRRRTRCAVGQGGVGDYIVSFYYTPQCAYVRATRYVHSSARVLIDVKKKTNGGGGDGGVRYHIYIYYYIQRR